MTIFLYQLSMTLTRGQSKIHQRGDLQPLLQTFCEKPQAHVTPLALRQWTSFQTPLLSFSSFALGRTVMFVILLLELRACLLCHLFVR